MDNICAQCQELVSYQSVRPHAQLKLMSSLPNSQLYKCSDCGSYLHAFDQDWEVLIEGGEQPTDSPSHIAAYA